MRKVWGQTNKLWIITCAITCLFLGIMITPLVFIIYAIACGFKYAIMTLVFFFDLAFDTHYHYKFFKED